MRIAVVALVSMMFFNPVRADEGFARIAGGILVRIDGEGKLEFRGLTVLPLDDGRTLKKQDDGTWRIDPPTTSEVRKVSPIDLAVYGETFVGRRLTVAGRVFGVDVESAIMSLPGGAAYIDLEAVPRDIVRSLVQNCSGLGATSSNCTVEVTGRVTPETGRGKVHLKEVSVNVTSSQIRSSRP